MALITAERAASFTLGTERAASFTLDDQLGAPAVEIDWLTV